MSKNKKESLIKYYELLMKEYSTSTIHLEKLVKKASNKISSLESLDTTKDLYLKDFDAAINNMSTLTGIIRNLNDQLERCNIDFKDKNANILTYTPPDLSEYNQTKTIECVITHVISDGYFYVTEMNSANASAIIQIQETLDNKPIKLQNIPNDEVFGITLNETFFRAVKCNKNSRNKLFLLDVGETYSLTEFSMGIYQLSDECKKLPAQAILCKMDTKDANTFLQKNIYRKLQFAVETINLGVVYLKPITNPFLVTGIREGQMESETNPFRQNIQLTDDDLYEIDCNLSVRNEQSELTDEQMKELFEEPEMQTMNAVKAVVGYVPTDEKRYCRFYNPITNGCFKGSKCLLLHAPPIEGGYTRDVKEIQSEACKFEYPDIGSIVKVLVTHIVDVENIYAQILPFNSLTLKQTNLKELSLKINASKNILEYKKLEYIPAIHELVLALFSDNYWYRARILNIIDDDTVQVIYLDYGNCLIIPIEDVRQWSPMFNYLPFQAIKLNIANVLKIKENHWEAIGFLKDYINSKHIEAKILNISENVSVLLQDNNGIDVGQTLVNAKMAKFP